MQSVLRQLTPSQSKSLLAIGFLHTSDNFTCSIVTVFSKTFTLRQCPPFLIYPIFSAAVICVSLPNQVKSYTMLFVERTISQVYNAGFDEGLAGPAKIALWQCMQALQEMEVSALSPCALIKAKLTKRVFF